MRLPVIARRRAELTRLVPHRFGHGDVAAVVAWAKAARRAARRSTAMRTSGRARAGRRPRLDGDTSPTWPELTAARTRRPAGRRAAGHRRAHRADDATREDPPYCLHASHRFGPHGADRGGDQALARPGAPAPAPTVKAHRAANFQDHARGRGRIRRGRSLPTSSSTRSTPVSAAERRLRSSGGFWETHQIAQVFVVDAPCRRSQRFAVTHLVVGEKASGMASSAQRRSPG